MTFKVAALGPIPRDQITTHSGERLLRYGCVLYTTAVLSALMGGAGEVVPVSHLRCSDTEPVHRLLERLPGVTTTHVSNRTDSGDVIDLRYIDQNRRIERQTGFMSPIAVADVAGLHNCDAFVFVPVTDFEVSLDVLRFIKQTSHGLIILDAHGPTTTATRHGERLYKYWIDRDLWLPHVDILKMNREEAACTWYAAEYQASELDARRHGHDLPLDDLPELAEHCLNLGVSALYVTLDEDGCVVYFRDDGGKMQEHFVRQVPVDRVIDTTGCGDSFAGGLAFGLLSTGDYVEACQYANAAGAQRCASADQLRYLSLEDTRRQIRETYGPAPS